MNMWKNLLVRNLVLFLSNIEKIISGNTNFFRDLISNISRIVVSFVTYKKYN